MKFFKLTTSSNYDTIINLFDRFIETEQHHILTSYFNQYKSFRKGIHAYVEDKEIRGYYENGLTTHSNSQLLRSKSWFFIKIKETIDGKIIKGLIVGDVLLTLGIYSVLISQLMNVVLNNNPNSFIGFSIMLIFGFFFLRHSYKEQNNLYDDLITLLNKLDN